MRRPIPFLATAALLAATAPVAADIVEIPAQASVATVMDALVGHVEEAGATVFARIDHGAGAASIDQPIGDMQVLVFGNPKIGTPALADDPLAGLFLPLKILVFQNADGEVIVAYEDPRETFDDLRISEDAEYLSTMSGALQRFANKAAITVD
jgi:uncharacterized protein (DUF302 family)